MVGLTHCDRKIFAASGLSTLNWPPEPLRRGIPGGSRGAPAHSAVVRRPGAPGRAEPATAMTHAFRAGFRPRWIVRGRTCIVSGIIPVGAPLPYVPCISYNPQAFGFFSPTGWELAGRVLVVPAILGQPRLLVPEAEYGRTPRAAGVFPLGFGGELELPSARLLVEPPEKLQAIVPTDLFHRVLRTLEEARVGAHHGRPLLLRHRILAQVERLGDPNPMLRLLVARGALV